MAKNMGTPDRLWRLGLAILFFIAAWYWASLILTLVGLFTLFEALFSWCVVYQLMGKNTCPLKKE